MKVTIQYFNPWASNGKPLVLAEAEAYFVNVKIHDNAKIDKIHLYPDEQVVILSNMPDRIDVEQRGELFANVHIIGELEKSIWRDKPIQYYSDSISKTVMQKGELVNAR